MAALFIRVIALMAAAAGGGEPSSPVALCGGPGGALVLASGEVRAWPSGHPVLGAGEETATALDCRDGVAAVGLGLGRSGFVRLLGREGDEWIVLGDLKLKGVPAHVLLAASRVAALVERKAAFDLALADAAPRASVVYRRLPGRPRGLALAPDGRTLLVAVGREIRTFALETGHASFLWSFGETIGGLAASPASPRLLVAEGERVVAVDPADPVTRGILPERASASPAGRVAALAWTGRGEVAVALVHAPPSLLFLDGEDLETLEKRLLPETPAALLPIGPGRLLWADAAGEVWEAALSPAKLARARPPDRARLARPRPTEERAPVPPAAIPIEPDTPPEEKPTPVATDRPEPPPEKQPATVPTDLPEPLPEEKPATVAPGLPEPSPEEEPTSAPRPTPAAGPTRGPGDTPETAPEEGQATVTAPAPEEGTQPAAPAPEAAPPEKPNGGVPREPEASPEEEPALATPAPESTSEKEPRPVVGAAPGEDDVPGGTIVGRLEGRGDLVGEILVLGPDSLIRERARVRPEARRGAFSYRVTGLPPGRYRVMPMGPDGAALAARPSFAAARVSAAAGARADFTILHRW